MPRIQLETELYSIYLRNPSNVP